MRRTVTTESPAGGGHVGDDDKATKKKPPKPKLPGKKPPKSDKEATEKYKAAADFLDCKGTTLSLKPGKLDWLGLDITPSATFEQDKTKPGTINIKVELPLGSITLPTSVKDGKLNVDASSLPIGADDVKDGGDTWQVTTPPTDLHAVRTAIEQAGYKVKAGDLTMIPTTVVELTKESQAKTVLHLMDVLEDHDDVEAVYANFDIPDAVLEAVTA